MNYELQILLGLNCNFKCKNCLNNSEPGNIGFDISSEEVDKIVSEIELNQNFKIVSFSGGEPLLYLNQIQQLTLKLRAIRNDLVFSITTNGSLLKRYSKELEELQIDYAIISYDIDHSHFINLEKFKEILQVAKNLFKSYEVNFVYTKFPDETLIKELNTISDIKVSFNHMINSGRAKSLEHDASEYTHSPLVCPNLKNKYKITFLPKKGFTICCGPLVFTENKNSKLLFHASISEVMNGVFFKALCKAQSILIPQSQEIPCHNCNFIFSKPEQDVLEKFLSTSVWSNVIPYSSYEKLDSYNSLFNPKYIKHAEINTIINPFNVSPNRDMLNIRSGDHLSENDIEDFSKFTYNSFYQKHQRFYSTNDFEKFKKEQKIFFNLPYRYVFHYFEGKLIATIVLCFIEEHPYFKKSTWHIGYWGISDAVINKIHREFIKSSWGTLLKELNGEYIIAANIDYFNHSAIKMTADFNFTGNKVRLDPRV